MIKKILSTLLASSVLLVFSTFSSIADRPTIAIGGSVNYGGYVASGTEVEGGGNTSATQGAETAHRTAAMEVGYTSAFFEISMADRLTIGVEYMAAEVETDQEERTDTVSPDAAVISEANQGTSTVKVEFKDMITTYAELRLFNGMYAKFGAMEIDVESKESLHTSSSYGNLSLDGITYGIGYKNSWDNGVFLKTETMMHDWDDFKMTATSADATPNGNTISGNLDGAILSVRLGKAF